MVVRRELLAPLPTEALDDLPKDRHRVLLAARGHVEVAQRHQCAPVLAVELDRPLEIACGHARVVQLVAIDVRNRAKERQAVGVRRRVLQLGVEDLRQGAVVTLAPRSMP